MPDLESGVHCGRRGSTPLSATMTAKRKHKKLSRKLIRRRERESNLKREAMIGKVARRSWGGGAMKG